MAGRGPAMPNGWVYIMTNRRNGILYIGGSPVISFGAFGNIARASAKGSYQRSLIATHHSSIVMAGLVPAMTATCYMGHNQRDLV
jgi:hypothetical protein